VRGEHITPAFRIKNQLYAGVFRGKMLKSGESARDDTKELREFIQPPLGSIYHLFRTDLGEKLISLENAARRLEYKKAVARREKGNVVPLLFRCRIICVSLSVCVRLYTQCILCIRTEQPESRLDKSKNVPSQARAFSF
jgi:hypothetical protein